jgi:hypothetical protein
MKPRKAIDVKNTSRKLIMTTKNFLALILSVETPGNYNCKAFLGKDIRSRNAWWMLSICV